MKRNLRKLLLTRVYNVRSTTIFCVTSVTRKLLYTTTSALAWYTADVPASRISFLSHVCEWLTPHTWTKAKTCTATVNALAAWYDRQWMFRNPCSNVPVHLWVGSLFHYELNYKNKKKLVQRRLSSVELISGPLREHDFIVLMVIQVEIYFVMSATLNGIWCIVTVSDLQQQQQLWVSFVLSFIVW